MKKNIVIIVLVILVLGLGGYLVYDKMLSRDNNEIENKEESYDIVAAKVIVDSFLNPSVANVIERIDDTKLGEDVKLAIAIANTNSFNNYTCNEVFDINTNYGEYRTQNEMSGCAQSEYVDSFAYDSVNNQYKKLFGNSKDASKKAVLDKYETYEYSTKKDVYVELTPQWGPIIPNSYYYEVKEAKSNNNELKIKISYLTYIVNPLAEPEELTYYINNIQYKTQNMNDIKYAYTNNESVLPTLTFIFEKDNNNYILKTVE